MHKLIEFAGKKYGEHAFKNLQIASQMIFSFFGFPMSDTIHTKAGQ